MTDPPEDKSRLVARLAADYLLRSLTMIGELSHGELLTGLVNLALVQANVAHLDRVSSGFDAIDKPPPDEVRRPVSVLSLSASLGLPYETTRRHVARMLATGQCVRVKGGIVVPTAIVEDARRSKMLEANLVNLRRLVRALRSAGVDMD
ncbi:hypothetical protein [Phenylobacterium sp.]|uniref:hypothetical protein n=1 Tax=Phenylobacterium sp. TaxID=1871053 RepID=UPI0035657636